MTFSYRPYQRVHTVVTGDSRTVQSEAEGADVNNIVARYHRTGQLPPNPRGQEGQYMDVTPFQGDLTEMYNKSLEDSERLTHELEAARQQADAREEDAPSSPSTDQPKKDQDPAPDSPKGAHSSE